MRFRAALLLLTLGGFALRVWGLGRQSFWLDEVDAIAMAAEPVAAHLRKLSASGENGPLYFLLLKGWLALAGASEFGARYFSTLASTAAIPLLGALVQRLFAHRAAALAAAALAALSPFYVWYAQDAKMYPLYAALALGAQYAFLRGWRLGEVGASEERGATERRGRRVLRCAQDGRAGEERGAGNEGLSVAEPPRRRMALWWLAHVACASCALYVHLFAALQIAASTAAGLWLWPRHRSGRTGFVIATVLLTAPYLPLAAWQAPVLLKGADVGYRAAGLGTISRVLLEQLTWHLSAPPPRSWLVMLCAILAYGFWRILRSPPSLEAAAVLLTWLVVPVVLVALLQARVPVFRDRYFIPLLAPLLAVCAHAMAPVCSAAASPSHWPVRLPSRAGPQCLHPGRETSALAGALLLAGFVYGLAHRPHNPDFRAAAALVHRLAGPDEQVGFLAEYAQRPFDFYFRQRPGAYQKVTLPYTNYPNLSERDGLLAVARSLRGGRWLWVVRFEDWLWDGRDLTRRYLEARGAREVLSRDFDGVTVTRYEMPQ